MSHFRVVICWLFFPLRLGHVYRSFVLDLFLSSNFGLHPGHMRRLFDYENLDLYNPLEKVKLLLVLQLFYQAINLHRFSFKFFLAFCQQWFLCQINLVLTSNPSMPLRVFWELAVALKNLSYTLWACSTHAQIGVSLILVLGYTHNYGTCSPVLSSPRLYL